MRSRYKYILKLGVVLSIFSALLYVLNYFVFGDAYHIVKVFCEELAFMPVYVFIVAVVAERLLWRSERNEIARRTNALVGTFINEIGYDIMRILIKHDANFTTLKASIQFDDGWDVSKVQRIHKLAETYIYGAPEGKEDIEELGAYLASKKDFMLILMSNASLIEKDEFSELLLAVNHINEAMTTIGDCSGISQELIDHLHEDLQRVYRCLIGVWASYLMLIEKEDLYLYKLAIEQSKKILSFAADSAGGQ